LGVDYESVAVRGAFDSGAAIIFLFSRALVERRAPFLFMSIFVELPVRLGLDLARARRGVKLRAMFLKRILLFLALIFSAQSVFAAQAYIIVDDKSGFIFAAANAKDKHQIGSLTKVATACVVLDWADKRGSGALDQVVSIPPQAFVGIQENNIGFSPGDEITLRDLMYAALVQSDNIAAFTLAAHVGSTITMTGGNGKMGPVDIFVSQMNALATNLKMTKTRFVNPHGIDVNVRSLPYSTAEDLARLTRYAMSKAAFRFYVSQHERQISFRHLGKTRSYMLRNTNELVGTQGVDGVKTGQTARAGQCLILSARRESEVVQQGPYTAVYPRHLIVVLLGSTNRFGEGAGLLARGWQLFDAWSAAGKHITPEKTLQ
jgi:serine-type D-Ala-D-Ala carboxypeptidase (penicillin-binding protein 5/6)